MPPGGARCIQHFARGGEPVRRLRRAAWLSLALLSLFTMAAGAAVAHMLPARLALWRVPTVASRDLAQLLGCIAESGDLSTPVVATADYGYLRLRREDYADADMERWAKTIGENSKVWPDVFVYLKHEESGIGPKLAKQLMGLVGGTGAVPSQE